MSKSKLRNSNDHVVIYFVSNFRMCSDRVVTVNWLNRLAESRVLSIKVGRQTHLYEVYIGMFHDSEPCAVAIDELNILHNYSNIVSFHRIFQKNKGNICNVNECKTCIHDAHIDLYIQPVHS